MTLQDLPEFVAILNGLAAIKPGTGGKLGKEALKIWELAMADWPIERFREAASHLARAVEFMPSPFHFEQLRKAGRPTSGEVWAMVLACARSGDEHPDVSPAAKRALAAIGGIRAVMMSETSKTQFLAKSFAENFEAMQDADDVREAVPQIAGPAANARLNGPRRVIPQIARQP